jgi:molybdopterin-guanine dinucleotide biosynthesis protein A
VPSAGLLLTGGASRRMGRAKAGLVLPDGTGTLAGRTARLLSAVASPVLEAGPGWSPLPAVADACPGAGPLPAVVRGWRKLCELGWAGPVLVVATDLPWLTEALLRWLAEHPSSLSVVPAVRGVLQPLCARYCQEDLRRAAAAAASGRLAARELLAGELLAAGEEAWGPAAGDLRALEDVDTEQEWLEATRPRAYRQPPEAKSR